MEKKESAEKAVREIRRKTRRRFSAEEKIRIVIEGLRGEESIASLCRREGIAANLYYRWSKEFLEAGKKRLLGDTKREASTSVSRPGWSRQVSSQVPRSMTASLRGWGSSGIAGFYAASPRVPNLPARVRRSLGKARVH